MRGKDLAGIAALGTLGYMLANRKKDADVDTSKVSDMDLTGGARSPAVPMGDMKDTEFGDLAGAQDAAQSRAVAVSLARRTVHLLMTAHLSKTAWQESILTRRRLVTDRPQWSVAT